MTRPLTMFEKIWNAHVIEQYDDGAALLWIDRHLINEGTSLQAFAELRERGLPVARPEMNLAVADHVPPTKGRYEPLEARAGAMIEALERNARDAGIAHIAYRSKDQGICHVIGPEQGFILPGMTAVCGDSHTSTLGGLGALAFGIGTSELAHVLATGTLVALRPRVMSVRLAGRLAPGVTAKDMVLAVIGAIGTAGGTGHAIQFSGEAVEALDIEGRLTLCNMAIEAGARSGMVAPDDRTIEWLKGRRYAPTGDDWERAVEYWRSLPDDPGAQHDTVAEFDAATIAPQVTWGTSPRTWRASTMLCLIPPPTLTLRAGPRWSERLPIRA